MNRILSLRQLKGLVLTSVFIPALSLAQEASTEVPIYSPEEAVRILKGELVPDRPYYQVDYGGSLREVNQNSEKGEALGFPETAIRLNLSASRVLEGSEASAVATNMFLERIRYELADMEEANIELVALGLQVTVDDVRLLGSFAKEAAEQTKIIIAKRKTETCSKYSRIRAAAGNSELSENFNDYSRDVYRESKDYYFDIYLRMTEEFPPKLYETIMSRIDQMVVNESDQDPLMLAIYETSEPKIFLDKFCGMLQL